MLPLVCMLISQSVVYVMDWQIRFLHLLIEFRHYIAMRPIHYVSNMVLFCVQPVLTKEEEERIFAQYNYTGATTNIHPFLSNMVNYTQPVKLAGFEIAERKHSVISVVQRHRTCVALQRTICTFTCRRFRRILVLVT